MIEHTVKVRALFLVRSEGTNFWYLNDQLHREDGPAIEDFDGRKEWWLNGKQVTEEEHRQQTRPTCNGKTVEIDG